uniref:Uncharacterized protein n=1 Tax=Mesocestoides corti TaxID=53468 RepID=A0A5K3EYT9_MESCO
MPLERRKIEDWLRAVWSNIYLASAPTNADYPSPRMKEAGETELALLTIHKPESHIRLHLSDCTTLTTPFIICHFSNLSISAWLYIFLVCPWNAKRQRIG